MATDTVKPALLADIDRWYKRLEREPMYGSAFELMGYIKGLTVSGLLDSSTGSQLSGRICANFINNAKWRKAAEKWPGM